MAKKQTRRSISIRGATYAQLRDYTESAAISMSDFVEQRIAEFFTAHPGLLTRAAQAPLPEPVKAAPRIAIARAEPLRLAPLPRKSAVLAKPVAPTAALRVSAPAAAAIRTNEGRPKPTPAQGILKARTTVEGYRGIRF